MSGAWPEPEGGYRRMGDVVPHEPTQDEQEQLSLFKIAKRWSPATVAVYLRLPEANARTHMVACAMGNAIRRDGTFAPARDGKDVIGVYISKNKRKLIRKVLDITAEHFSRMAADWEKRQIAHRCDTGELCLWITPLMEECPACKQNMHLSGQEALTSSGHDMHQSGQPSVPIPRDALRDGEGDEIQEPWFSKKNEMLEKLKNLDGYKEELAAKEAKEDE